MENILDDTLLHQPCRTIGRAHPAINRAEMPGLSMPYRTASINYEHPEQTERPIYFTNRCNAGKIAQHYNIRFDNMALIADVLVKFLQLTPRSSSLVRSTNDNCNQPRHKKSETNHVDQYLMKVRVESSTSSLSWSPETRKAMCNTTVPFTVAIA